MVGAAVGRDPVTVVYSGPDARTNRRFLGESIMFERGVRTWLPDAFQRLVESHVDLRPPEDVGTFRRGSPCLAVLPARPDQGDWFVAALSVLRHLQGLFPDNPWRVTCIPPFAPLLNDCGLRADPVLPGSGGDYYRTFRLVPESHVHAVHGATLVVSMATVLLQSTGCWEPGDSPRGLVSPAAGSKRKPGVPHVLVIDLPRVHARRFPPFREAASRLVPGGLVSVIDSFDWSPKAWAAYAATLPGVDYVVATGESALLSVAGFYGCPVAVPYPNEFLGNLRAMYGAGVYSEWCLLGYPPGAEVSALEGPMFDALRQHAAPFLRPGLPRSA